MHDFKKSSPEKTVVADDTLRRVRIPPGQREVAELPVLSAGPTPAVDLENWRFRISGLVEVETVLTYAEFRNLPIVRVHADFHCVTTWSRLDCMWEGVLAKEVLKLARPKPEAQFLMAQSIDRYTTNIDLEGLNEDEALFAWGLDGEDLTPDHGFPLRLVVPKRYGWESAKWVNKKEFSDNNLPGFWESRGYHINGDCWKEERFS